MLVLAMLAMLAMPGKSVVEIQTNIRFHFPIHFYFITLYVELKIIKIVIECPYLFSRYRVVQKGTKTTLFESTLFTNKIRSYILLMHSNKI